MLIGFIAITTVSIIDLTFQYIIFLIFISYFIAKFGSIWPRPWPKTLLFYLPFLAYLTWPYALAIAIGSSTPFAAYSRNFAGLWFYLLFYPIMKLCPSTTDFIKLFRKVSLVYSGIVLVFIIPQLNTFSKLKNYFAFENFQEEGLAIFRLYYSIGVAALFVPIAFILFGHCLGLQNKLFFRRSFWGAGKLIDGLSLILLILLILASGSKGFYISCLMLLIFVLILVLVQAIKQKKTNLSGMILFILISSLFIGTHKKVFPLVITVLNIEFDEDFPRVIQARELVADYTFWGKGLGASLSSGYSRDELSYGFELSFHNLVHKLGVMSSFVFFVIAIPFVKAIRKIVSGKDLPAAVLSLSLMLYIFPSLGNPTLIAPEYITFNVIAYYLMMPQKRIGLLSGKIISTHYR